MTGPDNLQNLNDLYTLEQQAKWAAWVNSEYQKCKNARLPFENQWYVNLAFVNGRHYISPINVPGQGMRLVSPKVPAWRVRLTINKIRTAVRKECSKLTQSRPIPTVIPATTEYEDYAAAGVAEHLLQNAFGTSEFQQMYRDWIWWGSVCGVSFMKSYWNPNEPDTELNQPNKAREGAGGEPLRNPDGSPIMQDPVMGRIMKERITPFHIFVPDLLTVDINKQPYVIHVMTRSKLWVEEAFKPNFEVSCDTFAASTIMENATMITKGSEAHLDSVLVKEMWIKKNTHPDFPEGGMLTVVNGKCVQIKTKWPMPFTEYPFYKYDGIPTGGFYSDSMVVDLIPLQKEYNRTRSQMVEIKNTIGKPKLLYQSGSLNPKQITTEPGQAIPYRAGYQPPVVMPAAEVPQSMVNEITVLSQDFDDISNQHEISRGDTPNNAVSSGTAIAFLQEQDDTSLSYQIGSIEGAMELLGKHELKFIATYWTTERTIRIGGKDQVFETRNWKASDLRGNTDVKIQAGSALPVSKAAKQAMLTEYMQLGWIAPEDGMAMMGMGGLDKVLDEILIDKKQAQRENLIMSKMPLSVEMLQALEPPVGHGMSPEGQPIDLNGEPWAPEAPFPVNSWDNHELHIKFHNDYRKTQEFSMLDEDHKKAFELHVQTHQMALTTPQQGTLGTVANQPDPAMEQEQALAQEQQAVDSEGSQLELDLKAGSAEQQAAQSDELHKMDLTAKQRKIEREDEAHQNKIVAERRQAALKEAERMSKIQQTGKREE